LYSMGCLPGQAFLVGAAGKRGRGALKHPRTRRTRRGRVSPHLVPRGH
jgi:hypothetical protein